MSDGEKKHSSHIHDYEELVQGGNDLGNDGVGCSSEEILSGLCDERNIREFFFDILQEGIDIRAGDRGSSRMVPTSWGNLSQKERASKIKFVGMFQPIVFTFPVDEKLRKFADIWPLFDNFSAKEVQHHVQNMKEYAIKTENELKEASAELSTIVNTRIDRLSKFASDLEENQAKKLLSMKILSQKREEEKLDNIQFKEKTGDGDEYPLQALLVSCLDVFEVVFSYFSLEEVCTSVIPTCKFFRRFVQQRVDSHITLTPLLLGKYAVHDLFGHLRFSSIEFEKLDRVQLLRMIERYEYRNFAEMLQSVTMKEENPGQDYCGDRNRPTQNRKNTPYAFWKFLSFIRKASRAGTLQKVDFSKFDYDVMSLFRSYFGRLVNSYGNHHRFENQLWKHLIETPLVRKMTQKFNDHQEDETSLKELLREVKKFEQSPEFHSVETIISKRKSILSLQMTERAAQCVPSKYDVDREFSMDGLFLYDQLFHETFNCPSLRSLTLPENFSCNKNTIFPPHLKSLSISIMTVLDYNENTHGLYVSNIRSLISETLFHAAKKPTKPPLIESKLPKPTKNPLKDDIITPIWQRFCDYLKNANTSLENLQIYGFQDFQEKRERRIDESKFKEEDVVRFAQQMLKLQARRGDVVYFSQMIEKRLRELRVQEKESEGESDSSGTGMRARYVGRKWRVPYQFREVSVKLRSGFVMRFGEKLKEMIAERKSRSILSSSLNILGKQKETRPMRKRRRSLKRRGRQEKEKVSNIEQLKKSSGWKDDREVLESIFSSICDGVKNLKKLEVGAIMDYWGFTSDFCEFLGSGNGKLEKVVINRHFERDEVNEKMDFDEKAWKDEMERYNEKEKLRRDILEKERMLRRMKSRLEDEKQLKFLVEEMGLVIKTEKRSEESSEEEEEGEELDFDNILKREDFRKRVERKGVKEDKLIEKEIFDLEMNHQNHHPKWKWIEKEMEAIKAEQMIMKKKLGKIEEKDEEDDDDNSGKEKEKDKREMVVSLEEEIRRETPRKALQSVEIEEKSPRIGEEEEEAILVEEPRRIEENPVVKELSKRPEEEVRMEVERFVLREQEELGELQEDFDSDEESGFISYITEDSDDSFPEENPLDTFDDVRLYDDAPRRRIDGRRRTGRTGRRRGPMSEAEKKKKKEERERTKTSSIQILDRILDSFKITKKNKKEKEKKKEKNIVLSMNFFVSTRCKKEIHTKDPEYFRNTDSTLTKYFSRPIQKDQSRTNNNRRTRTNRRRPRPRRGGNESTNLLDSKNASSNVNIFVMKDSWKTFYSGDIEEMRKVFAATNKNPTKNDNLEVKLVFLGMQHFFSKFYTDYQNEQTKLRPQKEKKSEEQKRRKKVSPFEILERRHIVSPKGILLHRKIRSKEVFDEKYFKEEEQEEQDEKGVFGKMEFVNVSPALYHHFDGAMNLCREGIIPPMKELKLRLWGDMISSAPVQRIRHDGSHGNFDMVCFVERLLLEGLCGCEMNTMMPSCRDYKDEEKKKKKKKKKKKELLGIEELVIILPPEHKLVYYSASLDEKRILVILKQFLSLCPAVLKDLKKFHFSFSSFKNDQHLLFMKKVKEVEERNQKNDDMMIRGPRTIPRKKRRRNKVLVSDGTGTKLSKEDAAICKKYLDEMKEMCETGRMGQLEDLKIEMGTSISLRWQKKLL